MQGLRALPVLICKPRALAAEADDALRLSGEAAAASRPIRARLPAGRG